MQNITYISAGAGSGKTTRIIEELVNAIKNGMRPSEIMMTTFTRAAAQEMQERAKKKLLESGMPDKANEMGAATIGTIHSVCLRFIQKYWYLVGLSPDCQQMDENDFNSYVDLSLFRQVKEEEMQEFEKWRKILDWKKNDGESTKPYVAFWRDWLRTMVNKVRYYHIDDLKQSREKSVEEINAVFARYAFNRKEYDQCKQDLIDVLLTKTKKDGTLQQSASDRLEYLKTYDPVACNGKVEIKELKGIEDVFQEWVLAATKAVFSNEKNAATINIVEKLFDILIEWREEYQCYKQTHKMLDFNDMEVYFSQLLEKNEVKAEIGNYKLVLVDEYQDCNPMQVDIFKRISDLVPRSIWVGDPKQAIYGFRGTDTALVKEVSDQIVDGENGCLRASLDTSYRSRKELVEFVNNGFLPIFRNEPFTLPDDEIKLEVGRKYAIEENPPLALQSWIVKKGRSIDFTALAHNIRGLVESGQTYVEPKGQSMRLAQYGDIAILVRKNGTVSNVTKALRDFGVPFFATDDNDKKAQPIEQKLLMALAQYKFTPKYRPHLRADILHLLKNISTEDLLNDYFAHISVTLDENNKRQYNGRNEWKTDDDLIQRIDQIITDCYVNGLYDTLATLVDRLRIYDLVAMWGDSEIRRSNISRTLRLAEDFDHHCEILNITDPTFAQYAEYMAEAQAKTELDLNSPSVKVLTMHKSKGLEWPIVIYYDGDNDFAEDKKIAEREFFSIREQRNADDTYWLRVFPCITDNSTAYQCLYDEDYFKKSKQRVEADETRLRYVAFTRARDILITVSVDKEGASYAPESTSHTYTLIDTDKTQQEGSDLAYLVNPSRSGITSDLKPSDPIKVDHIDISEKKDDVRMSTIGTCIHNIYAACNPTMDDAQATEMGQKIIESVKLSEILNANEVITVVRSLYDYLTTQYGVPTSVEHEVPFSFVRENGQLLRGEIDLLWHTGDGVVLVDYKNIQGEEANPEHYASQMEAYREVLKSAGLKCKGIILFYATLGQIIELK
jgi:ATP-dependent exoDNAse (exonuclease V) beta subunit